MKSANAKQGKVRFPVQREVLNTLFLIVMFSTIFSLFITSVYSVPEGPTVTILSNTTKSTVPGELVNSTINGSSPGGYIFTMGLNGLQQNIRWKAYVGNVTGTLTLDDAIGNTLFQWALTEVSGEVYATRGSGSINWTGINCTWAPEGVISAADSNRTIEEQENDVLSHSGLSDNITATFALTNHSAIDIGGIIIGKNECFSVQTYQSDSAQTFADSDDANFTQVILWDGATNDSGNVVYVTQIEDDITGFDNTETFDFQMMLPEDGSSGFAASTGYYFYVELT